MDSQLQPCGWLSSFMTINYIAQGYSNIITGNYDKSESSRRITLCKQCNIYNSLLGICSFWKSQGCGCIVKIKATVENATCPHNVWLTGHTDKTLIHNNKL